MVSENVVVLGGGVAGLSTALLLARQGLPVQLFERDPFALGDAQESPQWSRKGIPHFLQPHAFMPGGRMVLRERLPDVYAALIEAGAQDVNMQRMHRGSSASDDEDLQYLAVRRPLIEWALRRAVESDTRIEVHSEVEVTGLSVDERRVTGITTSDTEFPAGLVVDAMGRRMRTTEFLAQHGIEEAAAESTDCGVVYYSRYYRLRQGFELPDGPWLLGPRGDLGYMGYSTFPGDNRTFAALLAVPPGRASSRGLKEEAAFEAAIAAIPAMRLWVDPQGADPITGVLTMAGLRNTYRNFPFESVTGLIPVGDALCHSDPVLALGLSFALTQAAELSDAVTTFPDLGDLSDAYRARTVSQVRERFDFASQLDDQRVRMWSGESIDFTSPSGAYALFTIVAGGAAALVDLEVCRVMTRRNGLIDSLRVLDDDAAMQSRIEEIFRARAAAPRAPGGPTQVEMDAIIAGAKLTRD